MSIKMQKWLSISNQIDKANQNFGAIAKWAVLLMIGIGFWNVIGRHVGMILGTNLSSNRLIESQWYLFDCTFLLGLGWTLQRQGHVRVDILQNRWDIKRKAKIELIGSLVLLLPFAIGVVAISLKPTLYSWLINEVSPDPNGLPRYWIKTLIPLGFLLLALQGFSEAIKNWASLKKV